MPIVALDEVELFVTEVGTGPPCLVMHGGLGLDQTYMRTLDPLGDTFRLLYYDHRCNGRSSTPPLSTLTIEQLATDADALRAELAHERVAVLGHSYGAFVALEYATRFPDRVTQLLLIAGAPRGGYDEEIQRNVLARNPPPEVLAALASEPTTDEEYAAMLRDMLPLYLNPDADVDAVAKTLEGTEFKAAAGTASMEAWSQWDATNNLAAVSAPTLVVGGGWDWICPRSQAEAIATGVSDAELVVWDDVGHFPWLEQPERFFDLIRSWAKRTAR